MGEEIVVNGTEKYKIGCVKKEQVNDKGSNFKQYH